MLYWAKDEDKNILRITHLSLYEDKVRSNLSAVSVLERIMCRSKLCAHKQNLNDIIVFKKYVGGKL